MTPRPTRRGLLAALDSDAGLGALEPVAVDPGGRTLLLEILADPESPVRARVAACFVLSHYQAAKRPVVTMAALASDLDEAPALRRAAVQAVIDLDPARGLGPMLVILGDTHDDPSVREAVADAVCWLGDDRAVGPLREVLADTRDHPAARAACAHALGYSGDPKAAEVMFDTVVEDDIRMRFWSVSALGELGRSGAADPDEVSAVAHTVADRDDRVLRGWWSVRKAADDAAEAAFSPQGSARPSMLRAVGPQALEAATSTFAGKAVRAARLPPERELEVGKEVRLEPHGDEVLVQFPWLGLDVRQPWDGTAGDLLGAAAMAGGKVGRHLFDRGLLGLRPWRDPEG